MDPRKGIKRVNRPVCVSEGSLLKKGDRKVSNAEVILHL